MKKLMLAIVIGVSFIAGAALADKVHDWHDLDEAHQHIVEAIAELEKSRKENHYDMQWHGARAETFLHNAEKELRAAIEAVKKSK